MDKHVLRLGLGSDYFLFPCFAKSSTGVMTACKVPIDYGNAWEGLHHVLSELCLPQVSLHSACASAATRAADAGLEVNMLMGGGGWTGTSVMSYIRSDRPLQHVQLALYNGLNGYSSGAVNVLDTQ